MISTTQGEPAERHLPIDEPPDSWTEPAAVLQGLISMHLDPDNVYRVPTKLAQQIVTTAERLDYHGGRRELTELGKRYKALCPDPLVLDQLRRLYQDRSKA